MAELKSDKDWLVIPIEEEHHIGMAQRAARDYARLIGFGKIDTALIYTSVSELARNIFIHAKKGTVTFKIARRKEKKGIEIVFSDQGPGIENKDKVLKGGYSTKGSLGIGLSGARRMMDEFKINTSLGKGTTIWIKKWL
jgi:serine/threonine-protein kinase RsbT